MKIEVTRAVRSSHGKLLSALLLVAVGNFSFAAPSDLEQAREMMDTYYGNPANLEAAQEHLERAIVAQPKDPEVYIEAARLAAKRGHIVGLQMRGNSLEIYEALLDRALALDPASSNAYVLKAEVYDVQGKLDAEKQALDKARELGTTDPWLWDGYGRYYERKGDEPAARAALARVIDAGVGDSSASRKAYITALQSAAWLRYNFHTPGDPMEYAQLARRYRHPADAWVLGSMARLFNFYGRYSDAIDFGQEAMRTMDHGVARNALSTALYGRAAELVQLGQRAEADRLVAQAVALGSNRDAVWEGFAPDGNAMRTLSPILQEMIFGPPSPPVIAPPAKYRNALPRPQTSS